MNNYLSEMRDIGTLKAWSKNPRKVSVSDFRRLLNQLRKMIDVYGIENMQLKPLICTADGTVLGGNTRLMAFRQLGVEKVEVTVVDAPDDATKLKYALSDNETAGFNVKSKMLGLIQRFPDLPMNDLKINLGYQVGLDKIMDKFGTRNTDNDEELGDYLGNSIKKIVLNFEGDTFKTTLNRLNKIITENKLNDASEAVIHLLKAHAKQ